MTVLSFSSPEHMREQTVKFGNPWPSYHALAILSNAVRQIYFSKDDNHGESTMIMEALNIKNKIKQNRERATSSHPYDVVGKHSVAHWLPISTE